MTVKNALLVIKVIFLVVLGLITVIGNLGLGVVGGFWACPFPVPFVMCNTCPVRCTFGQVRVWFFYGIVASGLVVGRVFCGVSCPAGVAQELVAKVPLSKIALPPNWDRVLRYLKYVLAILVLGIVIEATGVWTVLPPLAKVWSFLMKYADVVRLARLISIPIILLAGLFVIRAWCQYLCPVGTWLSPFNRYSLVGLGRTAEKCVNCKVCDLKCSRPPVTNRDEDIWDSTECVRCLQCYTGCQGKALQFKNRLRR